MFYPLDIFKTEEDGNVLWRAAVKSVAEAEAQIQILAESSPGEYLILNQKTGERVTRLLGPSLA